MTKIQTNTRNLHHTCFEINNFEIKSFKQYQRSIIFPKYKGSSSLTRIRSLRKDASVGEGVESVEVCSLPPLGLKGVLDVRALLILLIL